MTPGEPAGDRIADELKDRLGSRTERRRARPRLCFRRDESSGCRRPSRPGVCRPRSRDLNTRKGLRSFVDYNLIGALLKKNQADEAIQLARKSDLTHAQFAHVLTQAAAIVAKTERSRGMEILGKLLAEARRIDAGRPERAYALIALLAQFSANDKVRAWELVDETIKGCKRCPRLHRRGPKHAVDTPGKSSVFR